MIGIGSILIAVAKAFRSDEKANYLLRPIKPEEVSILEEFLYNAIFIPEGVTKPKREIIYEPEIYTYIKDFGKPDDYCFLVFDNEKPIGAAWARILSEPGEQGYGNIDANTPELAISVLAEYRNKGIGNILLSALHEVLRRQGYTKISLSVQKNNPATRLYLRAGYIVTKENSEDFIMVKKLNP
jgi:ribosomal protein S18 acetylase RimI-like enzyme